ncbi:MAG: flagellar filament capping protein FliD, partial [Betaproteobacteria bacterium]
AQLVALEKAPLALLGTKATAQQAQISAFGQVQSQISALTDAATAMSKPAGWTASKASSSNPAAASITATASAQPGSFSLDVDALATQQSVSSGTLSAGAAVGAGTLNLQLGTWSVGGTVFTAASGSTNVAVVISSTDNVAAIAAKINAANAGVVATAFNDGSSDRLLLSSKNTGAAAGFQVTQTTGSTLSALVFDPTTATGGSPGVGMAATGNPIRYGGDAQARINGLSVTSGSNTLASNIPGVTINLLATTTTGYGTASLARSPATLTISTDVTPGVGFVQNFVTAYNTLNTTLTGLTKYDASTQTAGLFQGDSSVVGLQNVMRRMLGSTSLGSHMQYLSDVGVELQVDGSLTINTPKLSAAANNGSTLQQFFTNNSDNPATNGFALKFRDFGNNALGIGGMVTNETSALAAMLANNAKQQTAVNDRATALQTQLQAQYSALDAQMASLNALNAYVAQQVASWNKSTA